MLDAKMSFLRQQAELSAVIASLQRAGVYEPTASDAQRQELRQAPREALAQLSERYASPVSHEAHVKNIVLLAQGISERCGSYLRGRHLRIGVAQKALNLYLKFLWCYGQIPTPPDCPFDSRIIAKLPPESQQSWTRLDSLDGYEGLVAAAKVVAAPQELAVWELDVFQGA